MKAWSEEVAQKTAKKFSVEYFVYEMIRWKTMIKNLALRDLPSVRVLCHQIYVFKTTSFSFLYNTRTKGMSHIGRKCTFSVQKCAELSNLVRLKILFINVEVHQILKSFVVRTFVCSIFVLIIFLLKVWKIWNFLYAWITV